jgi:transketolase
MDDTQTVQTPATDDLVFPSGTEVYDSIMSGIDPELLSANIPTLDAAYADETEEEKKARYERYSVSFAKYDEEYAKWESKLNSAVSDYRKTALQSAEAESRSADTDVLSQLEKDLEANALPAETQK